MSEEGEVEREVWVRRDSLGTLAWRLIGDMDDPFSMDSSAMTPLLDHLRADGYGRLADRVVEAVMRVIMEVESGEHRLTPDVAHEMYAVLQIELQRALTPVLYDADAAFRFLESYYSAAVAEYRSRNGAEMTPSQVTVPSVRVQVDPDARVGRYVALRDGRVGLVVQRVEDGYADVLITDSSQCDQAAQSARRYMTSRSVY